ncbi:MAG: transcriptional regulator GcvA [Rhizobiales bacterium]|nr:transcriptional regulator GcvA [Hyphomicrobiales bacterium]
MRVSIGLLMILLRCSIYERSALARQTASSYPSCNKNLHIGPMARRLPSLNALRAFEAAARHESFSAAAEELAVTHAAVSRHIRDLEAWLDVELFRRTGRGVRLTEKGEAYGAALTPLFDGLVRATQAIQAAAERPVLRVSVEDAFASWWLIPRMGRFAERHPDVALDIDPSDDLISFRAEDADLAIRYGKGPWEDVEVEKLIDLIIFPVCSKRHLERTGIKSPRELTRSVLLHDESKQWWAEWLEAAGARNVDATQGPMFRRFLALEAAATGQGFALADNVVAAEGLLEGWLVKPFALTVREDAYWIVRAPERPLSPPAEAFVEWLYEEMATTQERLAPILASSTT